MSGSDLIIWGTGSTTGTPTASANDGTSAASVSGGNLIATASSTEYSGGGFTWPAPISLAGVVAGDTIHITFVPSAIPLTGTVMFTFYGGGMNLFRNVTWDSATMTVGSTSIASWVLTTADITSIAGGSFNVLYVEQGPATYTISDVRFLHTGVVAAPVVSAISNTTDATSPVITWTTDQLSSSQVYVQPPGGVASYLTTLSTALVTSHSVTITGLTPSSTYSYSVISTSSQGTTDSHIQNGIYNTLTTIALRTAPPVISNISLNAQANSAAIAWLTDEPSNAQIQYGLTTGYGSTTILHPGFRVDNHVIIKGLAPNTVYHFRILSSDSLGNNAVSADYTFTTTAPDAIPDIVVFDGTQTPTFSNYSGSTIAKVGTTIVATATSITESSINAPYLGSMTVPAVNTASLIFGDIVEVYISSDTAGVDGFFRCQTAIGSFDIDCNFSADYIPNTPILFSYSLWDTDVAGLLGAAWSSILVAIRAPAVFTVYDIRFRPSDLGSLAPTTQPAPRKIRGVKEAYPSNAVFYSPLIKNMPTAAYPNVRPNFYLNPIFGNIASTNGIPVNRRTAAQIEIDKVPWTHVYADDNIHYKGQLPYNKTYLIEGIQTIPALTGNDSHVLTLDTDHGWVYESWATIVDDQTAANTAATAYGIPSPTTIPLAVYVGRFNLNTYTMQSSNVTSADAAGATIHDKIMEVAEIEAALAIDPTGLTVDLGRALRFTFAQVSVLHTVWPANCNSNKSLSAAPSKNPIFGAFSNAGLSLPLGAWWLMDPAFPRTGFTPAEMVITNTLINYGAINFDNGGNFIGFIGSCEDGWDNHPTPNLTTIHLGNGRFIDPSSLAVSATSIEALQPIATTTTTTLAPTTTTTLAPTTPVPVVIAQFPSPLPQRSQSQAVFNTNADAFFGNLPTFVTQANSMAATINYIYSQIISMLNPTPVQATSVTSLTCSIGVHTLTLTQIGVLLKVGQSVKISDTSSANVMVGMITSFNPSTGIMVVNVLGSQGSSTVSSWTIASL